MRVKIVSTIKKMLFAVVKYLISRADKRKMHNLDCSVWGLSPNEKQHLVIGGCDCVALAEHYGTPLFVVDKNLLVKNYNEFYESLKSHQIDFEIYYSYKTNPVPGILKVLHEIGAGAEVISPYELWLAQKLGVNSNFIIYNGPNKPDEALKQAIELGIKLININSLNEMNKIASIAAKLGAKPKVGVRLSTGVGWASQFGFKIKSGEAFNAFEKLSSSSHLEAAGIHVHLGTGIKNTGMYEIAIENIFAFINEVKHKLGIHIQYLDLGGGYGVPTVSGFGRIETRLHTFFNKPHTAPNVENAPSIKTFVKRIVTVAKKECTRYRLELPVLLFEPGRSMTSNTQILLSRVGDLKEEKNGVKIALTDAGINIASPTTWEYHEIFLANKMRSARSECYGIAGPICTPADLFIKSKKLPVVEVGDILAIMDAGAYFTSFSNNFSFPRAAVIMVADGRHWVVRERERFEDMTRLDKF